MINTGYVYISEYKYGTFTGEETWEKQLINTMSLDMQNNKKNHFDKLPSNHYVLSGLSDQLFKFLFVSKLSIIQNVDALVHKISRLKINRFDSLLY
jgi:hypothetical protein